MALILIVDDGTSFTEKVQTLLAKNYQFETLIKNSYSDVVSFVEIMGGVDAIITPEKNIKKEPLSERLTNYLVANKEQYRDKIKLVILGKNAVNYISKHQLDPKSPPEKVAHFCNLLIGPVNGGQAANPKSGGPKPLDATQVTELSATTVFQLPKGFRTQAVTQNKIEAEQSYAGINVYYFYSLRNLPVKFNYYAAIKKGVSVEYQIKFEKGTIIPKAEIEKLFQGFAPMLYVNQVDYFDALVDLSKNFLSNFTLPITSNDTRLNLNKNCYHILCHLFNTHNVDQTALDLVKNGLKSFESITNCKDSVLLFKNLLTVDSKFDYSYLHAHLTCVMLYEYIDLFDWAKNFTKNKLLYFSYFHDLSLGSHRLIKIHHNYQENVNKITKEENTLILEHADMTAKTLESVLKVPKEFVALIREHHGVSSGQGFYNQLNPRLAPLSKMILVIEAFVTAYLNLYSQKQAITVGDIKTITNELKENFNKPGYIEVATELSRNAYNLVFNPKLK